jgi:segregation and condensation protein B
VLSPRQIDEWLKNAMNPTKPGDADMGLPQEDLPLETAVVTDHGAVVQDLPEEPAVAAAGSEAEAAPAGEERKES